MTPGWPAMAIAASILSAGVTQTGHPGPCSNVTPGGNKLIDAVPDDRMRLAAADFHQRPGTCGDPRDRLDVPAGQRRDRGTRRRISRRLLRFHLREIVEGFARCLRVDDRDGEAGVHQHVVANFSLGRKSEIHQLDDAAECDAPLAGQFVVARRCFGPAQEWRDTSAFLLDQGAGGEDRLTDRQAAVIGRNAVMKIWRETRGAQQIDGSFG